MNTYDVIIIGGGQSALATAYFLKRENISFLILDSNIGPGGAWTHTWNSLKLFSPKEYSSLPGWMMPPTKETYPSKKEIINYLSEYEKRYEFEVKRPFKVNDVIFQEEKFIVSTDMGEFTSKVVISATGNWSGPFIPNYKGIESFQGDQIHSAFYQDADSYRGKRVLVVGGGNSGAQILAEVSKFAETIWVTRETPEFLPDDVDGRYLFNIATQKYQAMLKGEKIEEAYNLAKIVMVDSVKEARDRNILHSKPPFTEIRNNSVFWADGSEEKIDSIIWCTGFKSKLDHLASLNIINEEGKVDTKDSRSLKRPGLWLVGYGDWTGFASATLIGVQRTAKQTAKEVKQYLENNAKS